MLTIFGLISWRAYCRSKGKAEHALVVGLFCGVLVHQVYGLTDCITPAAKSGLFLWAILCLAMIIYLRAQQGSLNRIFE